MASFEAPASTLIRRYDTHRLIPSKYSVKDESVLTRIASNDTRLAGVLDLDLATNDRVLAENSMLSGIDLHELVFGVPYFRIVNAAFTHAHPHGSRFNGPDRGAWYAGFEIETAHAEVAFHKSLEYAEIGRFDDSVTYDDFLADFSSEFHDLRGDTRFAGCLDPENYVPSQTLAYRLFDLGSRGVVYPSVRHTGGTCLACFRPTLVGNVRKSDTYRFTWNGSPKPTIHSIRD